MGRHHPRGRKAHDEHGHASAGERRRAARHHGHGAHAHSHEEHGAPGHASAHDDDHDHDHEAGDHAHDHDPTRGTSRRAGRGHDHDEGHGHDHGAGLRSLSARRLLWALGLTASFMLVEVVVGLLTGSLALLSDAGHMFTDAGALALALYAQILAGRARTHQRTFGFRRAEILAALVNGTALGVGALGVIIEAARRLGDPPLVQGGPMLAVAILGLGVNLVAAWVLARGGVQNANVRAAFAHVLSDALGSVAAIVAGALVLTRGWTMADPVASMLISCLILFGAWRLVRTSVDILMEGAPAHLDVAKVEAVIRETPGVAGLHDLHLWSITEGFPVVTVHVILAEGHHGTDVAAAVAGRVEGLLGVAHVTVQPEAPDPSQRLVPLRSLLRGVSKSEEDEEGRKGRRGEGEGEGGDGERGA